MELNTQNKFIEEKGRTDEKNEILQKQVDSLQKKLGGSKTDLSFAAKIRFSIFGSIVMFISFILGYMWFNIYGEIDFSLPNLTFILCIFGVFMYIFIYILDDIFDLINF